MNRIHRSQDHIIEYGFYYDLDSKSSSIEENAKNSDQLLPSQESSTRIHSFVEGNDKCKLTLTNPKKEKQSYFTFPSPIFGRSPVGPYFTIPHYYGYCGTTSTENDPLSEDDQSPILNELRNASSKNYSMIGDVVNSVNYFVGIGILFLPQVLFMIGWIGLLLIIVTGILMNYTCQLISRCQMKYSLRSFPELVEYAFPSILFRFIISLLIYAQMVFDISIMFSFLFYFLHPLFETLFTSKFVAKSWTHSVVFILLLTTTSRFYRKAMLKYKIIFSAIGIISIGILIIFILYKFWEDIIWQFIHEPFDASKSLIQNNTAFLQNRVTLNHLIKSMGIIIFCYLENAVFPILFYQLENIRQYSSFTTLLFWIIISNNLMIASSGYLFYSFHPDYVRTEIIFDSFADDGKSEVLNQYLVISLRVLMVFIIFSRFPFSINCMTNDIINFCHSSFIGLKKYCCYWSYYNEQHDYSFYITSPQSTRGQKENLEDKETTPVTNFQTNLFRLKEEIQQKYYQRQLRLQNQDRENNGRIHDEHEEEKWDPVTKRENPHKLSISSSYSSLSEVDPTIHFHSTPFDLNKAHFSPRSSNHSPLGIAYNRASSGCMLEQVDIKALPPVTLYDKLRNVVTKMYITLIPSFSSCINGILRLVILFIAYLVSWKFQDHEMEQIAFFGGFFGIMISILLPTAFYFQLMKDGMQFCEKYFLIMLLLMGLFFSIASFWTIIICS